MFAQKSSVPFTSPQIVIIGDDWMSHNDSDIVALVEVLLGVMMYISGLQQSSHMHCVRGLSSWTLMERNALCTSATQIIEHQHVIVNGGGSICGQALLTMKQ
jgi:hypothetical protein